MALIAAPLINRRINPYRQETPHRRNHHHQEGRSRAATVSDLSRPRKGMSKTDDDLHVRKPRRNRDTIQTISHSNLKASRKISVSHPENLNNIIASPPPEKKPQKLDISNKKIPPARQFRKMQQADLPSSSHHRRPNAPDLPAIPETFRRPRGLSESHSRRPPLKSQTRPVIRHLSPSGSGAQDHSVVMRKRSRSEHCITDEIRRQMLEEANRGSVSPTSPSTGGNPFTKMWKNFRKLKIGRQRSEESPT